MSEDIVEYIDETPVEEEKKPVTLLDMLQYELKERMTIALDYTTKINSAKTEYKKKYFHTKLKKNNLEAAKILTAIQNVTVEKAQVYENPEEPVKE